MSTLLADNEFAVTVAMVVLIVALAAAAAWLNIR